MRFWSTCYVCNENDVHVYTYIYYIWAIARQYQKNDLCA